MPKGENKTIYRNICLPDARLLRFAQRNAQIQHLVELGKNCRQISDEIGLTRVRVWQITRYLGISFKTRKPNSACFVCNKELFRSPSALKKSRRIFCSQACYHSVRQGKYIPWRQGQRIARKTVSQHFALQPGHVVHHHDDDNRNNQITNLAVFASQSDHMAYHHGSPVRPIWDGKAVRA